MVRKLLGAATLAAVLLGGVVSAIPAKAADTCGNHRVAFGSTDVGDPGRGDDDNATADVVKKFDVGVISYEALPSGGVTKVTDAIIFENYPATDLAGGKLVVTLSNAEFANPAQLRLVYDNGTAEQELSPSGYSANKVEFDIPTDALSIEGIIQADQGEKIEFKIPGTLKVGDKVTINITGLKNNETVENGCIQQSIMIVENQFAAKIFTNDNVPKVDDEPLAVTLDGVTKLYDDGTNPKPTLTVAYNPCTPTVCNVQQQQTGDCCEYECPDCELICNTEPGGGGGGNAGPGLGNCVLPAPCNGDAGDEFCGLQIFQTADFGERDEGLCNPREDEFCKSLDFKPIVSIDSLAESTVKLELRGNFAGVSSVEFVGANGKTWTATIDEKNGVAYATVSGREFFEENNRDTNGAIEFSFRITVDGETQLSPRTFTADAEISGGELTHPVTLNWGKVMTWGLGFSNALAFKVPYVYLTDGVSSMVRLENTGNTAPVALFVSDPEGGWKLVKVLPVKKGEEVVITRHKHFAENEWKQGGLEDWIKDAFKDESQKLDIIFNNRKGRLALMAIVSRDPCDQGTCDPKYQKLADTAKEIQNCLLGGSVDACYHAVNMNLYSSQQVGTDVRFIPVEVLKEIPKDLH